MGGPHKFGKRRWGWEKKVGDLEVREKEVGDKSSDRGTKPKTPMVKCAPNSLPIGPFLVKI